ncbi:cytochrome P450 monooxygenase pc-1 [Mycena galericulata]|nr:cytochrome P450 monooxygenase pc-1 [Mycena galericulata]
MVSPGVSFLLRATPTLSVPLAVGFGLPSLCLRLGGFKLPTWVDVLLALASLPLYAAYSVLRQTQRDRRAAAALNARLVPVVRGASIGGVDLLKQIRRAREVGYPGDGLNEQIAALGPAVNFRILWSDTILTTAPEHIKLVLSTGFNNYVKGERFKFGMQSVLGDGVFNSDGDTWKSHRAMTRPFFTRDRISHFDIFDRHAEDVISILKQRMQDGLAVDFQDLIGRFTMDSASEFLFNACVGSLKAPLPYPHNATHTSRERVDSEAQSNSSPALKFTTAFSAAMLAISTRETIGRLWPLFEMFEDKTAGAMRDISEYLDPVIAGAIERKRNKEKEGEPKEEDGEGGGMDLLDELLDTSSDPQMLKHEMSVSGRDTTMHTLTVVIYFLTQYPAICTRLRAEIISQVGAERRPTYDDIKEMRYLRAVINETMRLYPSVPFNVRESVNAAVWPSPDPSDDARPLYIPAKTKISYSIFMMHRRKDLWGPDAEEFSPDRFLDDRLKTYLLKNTFQFLPFNAGPRICLGQQFAYNEMSFMIIRLLQAFSSFALDSDALAPEARPPREWALSAPEGSRKKIEQFRPKLHMAMSTEGGLWIRVKEAEKDS